MVSNPSHFSLRIDELTKRQWLGEESAPCKVAHHVPDVLDLGPYLTPRSPQLAFTVETPDRGELVSVFFAEDVGEWATRVSEAESRKGNLSDAARNLVRAKNGPSSEQYDVSLNLAAVLELEALASEALDLRAVLDLDLVVDNLLACANIYVLSMSMD